MKKMIIFGAGKYGKLALQYYSNIQNIAFLVDNSSNLWGHSIMGFEIKKPDILNNIDKNDYFVLIAVKNKENDIANQLKEYGFNYYANFEINQKLKCLSENNYNNVDKRIIEFQCGLGNQLFQYAFYKCMENKEGGELYADLSTYLFNKRNFELNKCFSGIKLNILIPGSVGQEYFSDSLFFDEKNGGVIPPEKADVSTLNIQKGYFRGFWQSYVFVQQVESVLKKDLVFKYKNDKGLIRLTSKLKKLSNTCSIHVRRGDYTSSVCEGTLGDVCDIAYYQKAIEYMLKTHPDLTFYLFSEDAEWLRENLCIANSIIIDKEMFDDYEDWYDMYLMSLCKHNIIANSTFSWWGAWLNNNPNKVIVAPVRWRFDCDIKDICPPEWTRL